MTKKLPILNATCPQCGGTFQTNAGKLSRGRGHFCSRACSCKYNRTKHGHTADAETSRTYHTWAMMVQRCTNPKNSKYYMYGGKGIYIDPRWLDFREFLKDMGERPKGKTLDRKNGSQGYAKDNCRWATPVEQQNNLKTNVLVNYQGETMSVSALARKIGVPKGTLRYRIRSGWHPDNWSWPPLGQR